MGSAKDECKTLDSGIEACCEEETTVITSTFVSGVK